MRKILLFLLGTIVFCATSFGQSRTVEGRVIDESGAPVPGSSVRSATGNYGTAADFNGNFTIVVSTDVKKLLISAVGFLSEEIIIPASNRVTVVLKLSGTEMEQVVVTGYSKLRRSEFAGTSTKVLSDKIEHVPMGSFDQILQGRIPGMTVLSTSGQPGSEASITIRGVSSISSSSDPLFVIDGVPVESGIFQAINPNDIASVDVLRDAVATALYGSRGAAGVIVVTTKRGTGGKAKLTYNGQFGTTFRPKSGYDMMDAQELLLAQEAYGKMLPGTTADQLPGWFLSKNHPSYATSSPEVQARKDFLYDSLLNNNTNWDEMIFRDGSFRNHEISLSGGSGKTRFYSSLGYYNEEGIIHRSDMKRFSFRNNIDYNDDRLSFALSSLIGYTKRNFQETDESAVLGNPFLDVRITPSYISPYNPDGSFAVGNPAYYAAPNQLDFMTYNKVYNDQVKVLLGTNVLYNLTPEIYAGAQAGVDFRETQNTVFWPAESWYARSSSNVRVKSGGLSEGLTRRLGLNGRVFAGYKKKFGAHDLDLSVHGELNKRFQKSFGFTGYGLDPKTPNTPAAITPGDASNQLYVSTTGSKSSNALSSLFGIGKYSFRDKYSFNLSYRYDGSSSLPEKNRFQSFYAIGAGWDLLKEGFMPKPNWLDMLRLRASYGESANANNFSIGNFGYLSTYRQGTYSGLTTIIPNTPGNADANWEYTAVSNIGLDFALLKNRLYGDFNIYDKRTKGLYVEQQLSVIGGGAFESIETNAGRMRNRGVELSLNAVPVKTADLSWSLYFNGAINNNKVTDLGGVQSYEYGTSLVTVGLPLGSHWENGWAGVDAATGKPLYYTKDGKITDQAHVDDRVQTWGTSEPKYTGGFGSDLRYKGLSVSAFFTFIAETYKYNNLEYFMENTGFLSQGFNQAKNFKFWQKPGDQVNYQNPAYENVFSSKYIQDASFLRLRNIMVAYDLPSSWLEKTRVFSALRIYVTGQNLLCWTNWKGYDPEESSNYSLDSYPSSRVFTAGLSVTF